MMKRSHKILLIVAFLFLVILSYHGMMASKIGFFDFSFLLAYLAGALTVISVAIGLFRRWWFLTITSATALLLIISSAYTTQSIVNYQVHVAQERGVEIVQSIYLYKEKNGEYPSSLAPLNSDSSFFLGMFPRHYHYRNEDTTFSFWFSGSSGGTIEWSEQGQTLFWYD